MADVFISYKREDHERARLLADALQRHAVSVWWDADLAVGDGFRNKIADELDSAACVLVLWSALSVNPDCFVISEASRAHKQKKLMPVRIDNVEPPLGLDQIDYDDLLGWTGDVAAPAFQGLLRQVLMRLRRPYKALKAERRALLVAVDQYEHAEVFPLSGAPVASAETLSQALTSVEDSGFLVTVKHNPTIFELVRAIKELAAKAAVNDLVLLYVAAHIRYSEDGELALCVADTQPDSLERSGMLLKDLCKELDRVWAEQVVVVLDCDYSSPAPNLAVESELQQAMSRGKGKHLIAVNTYASGASQASRSAFVQALAKGLSSFEADSQRDNVITLDEWFDYAQQTALAVGGPSASKWHFDVSPASVEMARRTPRAAPVDAPAEPVKPLAAIDPLFLDEVGSRWRRGRIIPLIGEGVYGSGPLSTFELIRELAQRRHGLKSDEMLSMATVAQYCLETNDNDRADFLDELRQTLESQTARCEPKLYGDFIQSLQSPWLVISTTYDWYLESTLAKAGVRFMVVAHVLRSHEGRLDGRVVVVRFGSEPRYETCLADELLPDEEHDCVIYKILGSPFLHDIAPKADGIDTVVVTETDHATFLSRLENKSMSVPACFAPPLRTRHVLYLGYNLDVWHYRLVGHVFSRGGEAHMDKPPYVVRQVASDIERAFWDRLNARRVDADTESFVKAIMKPGV